MFKYVVVLFLFSCYHKPVKNIVVLGNSILISPSDPYFKWYGNWGMAATCADSDFIHILKRKIAQKNPSCKVRFRSAKDFELNYQTFNFKALDSFKNADILIMRIGENVDKNAGENFIKKYHALIEYLNPATVIITDGFWKRDFNHFLKDFALKNDFRFVELSDLSIPDNEAIWQPNSEVAIHPNNKGMNAIADRIWKYLVIYF